MSMHRDARIRTSYENLEHRWDNKLSWQTYPLRGSISPDKGTGKENAFSSHRPWSRRHHLGISLALDIQATIFMEGCDSQHEYTPGCYQITRLVYPHTEIFHSKSTNIRENNYCQHTNRQD